MLKKIALIAAMIALPLAAMAQAKFAHMNAMAKQYQDEMQRTAEEFNKKYQEFLAQQDSLPQNIAERRMKELQDMEQRQQQFQQEAQQSMQKAQQDAMTPIMQKLDAAIQAVGQADGYVYIFDVARTPVAYISSQSVDVTAKVKAQLGIK